MIGNGSNALKILNRLFLEIDHVSNYFPIDSAETVTFTAGAVDNIFGAWVEVVDNNAVTFSSKLITSCGHISNISVEDASVKDKIYILEIAYGDSKIVVVRDRVLSASIQLSTVQHGRRVSKSIPAGKTIYYRLKCETGGATLQISLRYHLCAQ